MFTEPYEVCEATPPPEKTPFLCFDQQIQKWKIMSVEVGHGGQKFFVTDANAFLGYEPQRFSHWTNLPEKP